MSRKVCLFSIDNKTDLTLVEGTTYQINGINLEAPFELTPEQEGALETIINDFIHTENKNIDSFSFKGYAGTGKTSIINMVEQYIKQIGATIAFTAPTNRAVDVMRASNISSNATTIHRLLGLHLHIDIEVFNADLPRWIKKKKNLSKYNFVIVDEASMISDDLYFNIISGFVRTLGTRVIFMGDPAQLRPVENNDISMALTEPKLSCELTNVKRTSKDGVRKFLDKIRNGERFTLEPSDGHCFTSNEEEFISYFTQGFNRQGEDIRSYRVLCGTNNAVASYNQLFHDALYPDGAEYNEGELVMSYMNGTEGFQNSMDGIVTKIEETTFTIGDPDKGNQASYKGYYLTVLVNTPVSQRSVEEDNGNKVTIQVISRNNDWDMLKVYLHQLHDEAKREPASKNKVQTPYDKVREDYYFPINFEREEVKRDVTEKISIVKKGIDYGYAQTVHKSQGGTYGYVGIVINSFEKFEYDEDNYQQLLYVAFSRCKNGFIGLINGGADTIAFATADEVSDQASQHVESVSMPLPDVGNTVNEETRQFNYNPEEIPF